MSSIYLRGEDVAQILQISRSTAFRLLRSGKIRTLRIGRCVRTTQAELDRFVYSNMTGIEDCSLELSKRSKASG